MNIRFPGSLAASALLLSACSFLCGCGGGKGAPSDSAASESSGSESHDSGQTSEISAEDRAARDFVQSKLNEHWLKTADGWVTQLQVRNGFGQPIPGDPEVLFKQYRELNFSLHRESVTEAQKLNGADYRAAVNFKNSPVRFYRPQATIVDRQGWSMWEDGSPGGAIAVERRNGKWLTSGAEVFDDLKPDPANVPSGK